MNRTINFIGIGAVLATLLIGMAYAGSGITQPKMVGSQWAVYEQKTLPNGNLNFYPGAHATTNSAGGVQFTMPDASASSPTYVNYLLDTYTTSLTELNTITATINVQTSSAATTFVGNPNGGCPGVSTTTCPGAVRLFIQSNLPADGSATCVGGNTNVNNYWWADVSSYTFVPGSGAIIMSVPMNPADWSNICGQSGTSDQAGFDSAIANVKEVGLSFGSGYFFANGAGVDGTTGTATFQLQRYTIS